MRPEVDGPSEVADASLELIAAPLSSEPGCPAELVLVNTGSAPVEVDDLRFSAPFLSLVEPVELPLVLAPGEERVASYAVDLDFAGELAAEVSAWRGHEVLARAEIAADLLPSPRAFELHEAPVGGALDVMFVVDQSPSMAPIVAAVVEPLAVAMTDVGADWRAYPITRPLCRDLVYPEDGEVALARALDEVGQLWTWEQENGLALATWMAEDGCEPVRPGVALAVVFVSDERDRSPLGWEAYRARLEATTPRLEIHGLVGGWGLGPDDVDGELSSGLCAGRGDGYLQAAESTGGLWLDVCAPPSTFRALTRAFELQADGRVFRVERPAAPDSLLVAVDGVPAAASWSRALGRVVLDAAPAPGSLVAISYRPAPSCDGRVDHPAGLAASVALRGD